MISRIALILFLTFSAVAMASAQSQPKQLTKEEEQKKQEELRKKIKETLNGAVSDVALLKTPENKTFFQVRIASLIWEYDEKGARSLIGNAQGMMASLINDPKIKNPPDWYLTTGLRGDLISMIAQWDPQAALEFLRQTKFIITQDGLQSERVQGVLSFEARMEQRLALQVARNDPKRALEMAEESLEKGFSSELNELVGIVFAKDPMAGKKLAEAILSKLRSSAFKSNSNGMEVALRLLEGEYASRRPESTRGDDPPGAKNRLPVLDDQALREWNNFIINASLNLISRGAQTHREGIDFVRNQLSILMKLLPEIEKLSPALVANFNQRYGQLMPKMDLESKFRLETANAKAEDLLASAIKSQGELRKEYLHRAVGMAIDSEGNFELARKIAEENITDPDDRKYMTERIEERAKQFSLEHGKIEDVAASLASLESDAERAGKLADLAGRALKSGDKKLAAELQEKAFGFLPNPVETRDEYEAMIRIIRNSINIDPERGFEMFGSLIEPINQLVAAAIQVKRYEGKRSDGIRDDIPLGEFRRYSPARGFAELIASLSKADFDRAIGLADRIMQPELKLHMKLLGVQAAMPE